MIGVIKNDLNKDKKYWKIYLKNKVYLDDHS